MPMHRDNPPSLRTLSRRVVPRRMFRCAHYRCSKRQLKLRLKKMRSLRRKVLSLLEKSLRSESIQAGCRVSQKQKSRKSKKGCGEAEEHPRLKHRSPHLSARINRSSNLKEKRGRARVIKAFHKNPKSRPRRLKQRSNTISPRAQVRRSVSTQSLLEGTLTS